MPVVSNSRMNVHYSNKIVKETRKIKFVPKDLPEYEIESLKKCDESEDIIQYRLEKQNELKKKEDEVTIKQELKQKESIS